MIPAALRNIIESPKSTAWGLVAVAVAAGILVIQAVSGGVESITSEEGVAAVAFLVTGLVGLFKKDKS